MLRKAVLSFWPVLVAALLTLILFFDFFAKGLVPLPADITVGLYFPWLDYKWGYAVGVPVKNPLLSDIPSLLYPWRSLAIDQLKIGQVALWNPFYFSGMPLLANFQTAVFSYANPFFLFLPKVLAWSAGVIIQPFLATLFCYLFLRNRNLNQTSSLLGGIVFSLCGFSISWLEYNVHGHTALFLPLLLFLIDKYFQEDKWHWLLAISFAISLQIFAGYVPIVIYSYLITGMYILFFYGDKLAKLAKLGFFCILGCGLAAVQILPGVELVGLSIRDFDPIVRASNASFLPLFHLATLIAPDFFGNPATGNYWGQAFYDNFSFYVGTGTLILVLIAILSFENRFIRFWAFLLALSFLLVIKNPVGESLQNILRLKGGVAARALFITDFSLAILAAAGLEILIKEKRRSLAKLLLSLLLIGASLGILGIYGLRIVDPVHRLVALRNLVIPVLVFLFSLSLLLGLILSKRVLFHCFIVSLFVALVSFNLLYQAKKYLPFSRPELIFPSTPVIDFLQKQEKPIRFEPNNVIPQNMWMPYSLESASGSDALLPKRTGEFLTAVETGKIQKDISRVHLIQNYDSPLYPLLNAKYILVKKQTEGGIYSPEGKPQTRFLDIGRYKLVFEDKTIQVYEDLKALPRAFWVYEFETISGDEKIINRLFAQDFDLKKKIILEENPDFAPSLKKAKKQEIEWLEYKQSRLKMVVNSDQPGFIFLANNFYPGWESFVDSQKTKIYRANYTFQAIRIPEGRHLVEFFYSPNSFKVGLMISLLTVGSLLTGVLIVHFKSLNLVGGLRRQGS